MGAPRTKGPGRNGHKDGFTGEPCIAANSTFTLPACELGLVSSLLPCLLSSYSCFPLYICFCAMFDCLSLLACLSVFRCFTACALRYLRGSCVFRGVRLSVHLFVSLFVLVVLQSATAFLSFRVCIVSALLPLFFPPGLCSERFEVLLAVHRPGRLDVCAFLAHSTHSIRCRPRQHLDALSGEGTAGRQHSCRCGIRQGREQMPRLIEALSLLVLLQALPLPSAV